MLKELCTYLETNSSFVIGIDLFPGFAPADIMADCVIVIESGGKPNFYLPDASAKTIQILSRAKDYHVARANAQVIYGLLHGSAGITLPIVAGGTEYYVNTIEAISEPQSLGQDERGLFNISTNYILRIQDK